MRPTLVLLVAAVVASTLPGASAAGSYVPPPGDGMPSWSPDGSRFLTTREATTQEGIALAVVSADGTGERRLLDNPNFVALSPDWQWVAFTSFGAGGESLRVVRLDGSDERRLAGSAFGTRPAWSPDSRRIAFRASDQSISVVDRDGGDLVRLAVGGASPAWSPDGTRVAFQGGSPLDPDLHVVSSGGGEARLLAGGPGAQLEPKWSPDGTRIAFLTQNAVATSAQLGIVRPDGTGLDVFPGPRVTNPGAFAWMPDSSRLVYAHDYSQGLFVLELETGEARRLTEFGATPSPSPDGRRIAFAAGGECRDRYGIYLARDDGKLLKRLTNNCRIVGTSGDDVIRGTGLAEVLVGLGGDDRLFATGTNYVGDTLRERRRRRPRRELQRGPSPWRSGERPPARRTLRRRALRRSWCRSTRRSPRTRLRPCARQQA